jgi:DNA-binding beta-propeller fold protein YncE
MKSRTLIAIIVGICFALMLVSPALGGKKKSSKPQRVEPAAAAMPEIDTSKLVWPDPPDIARIKWVEQYRGEPKPTSPTAAPKKSKRESWMERLAGMQSIQQQKVETRFKLVRPYGVAVDSKGRIYAADTYVGAVFIFNTETKAVDFIRNGRDGQFKAIVGLAMDDNDRLFISDSGLKRIWVFNADHKMEASFGSDRLERPTGLALDTKNRLLYVVDVLKNCVAVFDADTFKFLRTIGGPPKKAGDEDPATFARPTNVAVDKHGNVYVSDTLNGRIQIFDADGNFLSMFGHQGDGPADLARPKGVAIDKDGHIWVTDADQNRVKVFNRKGELCAFFGEYGYFPGQFALPSGIAIDKQNRVVVAEQVLDGRLQVFRYVTDDEAETEKAKRGSEGDVSTARAVPVSPEATTSNSKQ